jgi:hypothetical protein
MKNVSTEEAAQVANLAEKITNELPEDVHWGLAVNALSHTIANQIILQAQSEEAASAIATLVAAQLVGLVDQMLEFEYRKDWPEAS